MKNHVVMGAAHVLTALVILTAACAVFCPCQNDNRGAGPPEGGLPLYGFRWRSIRPVTHFFFGFRFPFEIDLKQPKPLT
jgi:hypothetical protein